MIKKTRKMKMRTFFLIITQKDLTIRIAMAAAMMEVCKKGAM